MAFPARSHEIELEEEEEEEEAQIWVSAIL